MSSRILIIDDNEKNLKLARVILQSAGYETVEVADGMSALRISRAEHFDLILLDIQMPLMNGIEVLRALKSETTTNRIPAVALTSYAMKGDREQFLRDGFEDYIAKPIERIGFLATVQQVLERSRAAGQGDGLADSRTPGLDNDRNSCPGEGR